MGYIFVKGMPPNGSVRAHSSKGVKYTAMRSLLLAFCLVASLSCLAEENVKMFVQGDSSRLPDFVESCKKEFKEKE